MYYQIAISNTENIEDIKEIIAHEISILNLSDINKYINLESLYITNCTMKYDDLVNYDYSKFTKLKELVLIGNSTNKTLINADELMKILNEKIFLNNTNLTKKIVLNFINSDLILTIGQYMTYNCEKKLDDHLKKKYLQSELSDLISYDDFIKEFSNINKIIFDYEKNIYEKNYEIESKIPLNINIFKLSTNSLFISYYYLNEFFKLLPINSPLVDTLSTLEFNFKYDYIASEYMMTFDFYRYIYSKRKEHKITLKFLNSNILVDSTVLFDNEPICKFMLFKCLKCNDNEFLFKYLACDMYDLFKIDKYRPAVDFDNKYYNVVLYLNNECRYYNLVNTIINFKPNIEVIYMKIIRYIQNGLGHIPNEKLLCLQNLPPNLEHLNIDFVNEYADNYYSTKYNNNYLIDDNLPSTLTEINLTGISTKMRNNIKKIPYSCKLTCDICDYYDW